MVRFIILVILAVAVFWGFNNFNFSKVQSNISSSIQNEKTIKAVNQKRSFDYNEEQNVMNND